MPCGSYVKYSIAIKLCLSIKIIREIQYNINQIHDKLSMNCGVCLG